MPYTSTGSLREAPCAFCPSLLRYTAADQPLANRVTLPLALAGMEEGADSFFVDKERFSPDSPASMPPGTSGFRCRRCSRRYGLRHFLGRLDGVDFRQRNGLVTAAFSGISVTSSGLSPPFRMIPRLERQRMCPSGRDSLLRRPWATGSARIIRRHRLGRGPDMPAAVCRMPPSSPPSTSIAIRTAPLSPTAAVLCRGRNNWWHLPGCSEGQT